MADEWERWTMADEWERWTMVDEWDRWTMADEWERWTMADKWERWKMEEEVSLDNLSLGYESSSSSDYVEWTSKDEVLPRLSAKFKLHKGFPVSEPEVSNPESYINNDTMHFMLYLYGLEELGDGASKAGTEGSTSAAGTTVLEELLGELPEDIVEEILVRLPPVAQARCRAVCKQWHNMLAKPEFSRRSFLQSLSETAPPLLCAIRFCPVEEPVPNTHHSKVLRDMRLALRDRQQVSPLYKALRVDLSFLPEVFQSPYSEFYNFSSTGLMCIHDYNHMCLVNPLNQSFIVLPVLDMDMMDMWRIDISLSMGTDDATDLETIPSFQVYVLVLSGDFKRPDKNVAIYSNITGEWEVFSCDPSSVISCHGGVLYRRVANYAHHPCLQRLSAVKGSGLSQVWDMELPRFTKTSWDGYWRHEFGMVDYRGSLLCCCGGIWMLDNIGLRWVEIAERCAQDIGHTTAAWQTKPRIKMLSLRKVRVVGDLVIFTYRLRYKYEEPRERYWEQQRLECKWRRREFLEELKEIYERHGKFPSIKACVNVTVAYDMRQRFWREVPKAFAQLEKFSNPDQI